MANLGATSRENFVHTIGSAAVGTFHSPWLSGDGLGDSSCQHGDGQFSRRATSTCGVQVDVRLPPACVLIAVIPAPFVLHRADCLPIGIPASTASSKSGRSPRGQVFRCHVRGASLPPLGSPPRARQLSPENLPKLPFVRSALVESGCF